MNCLFHLARKIFQAGDLLGSYNGFLHLTQKIHKRFTLIHSQLSPKNIHSLDSVGSLEYHRQSALPDKLFHWILSYIAIAAIDLESVITNLKSSVCDIAFGEGYE